MLIGIHPDRSSREKYSDKWAEFLTMRGIKVRWLNLLALDALENARGCDGIMWRWAHNPQDKQSAKRILYAIEHYLGIPVYPDSSTGWHYDEKVSQLYLLRALQAPMPRTWLFWDRKEALVWAASAAYPLVFKLSAGAGSANVIKVNNQSQAVALINRIFKRGLFPYRINKFPVAAGFLHNLFTEYSFLDSIHWRPERGYAYFQEFVRGNEFDTRVTVIGDRAFAFRRINRTGDFRASGSGRIDYDPSAIDHRCIQIALQISKQAGFQSMAYDFLFAQGEPVISEISYAYADWAVHNCPGYWNPKLDWVEGSMWPEEAQVIDFIEKVQSVKGNQA